MVMSVMTKRQSLLSLRAELRVDQQTLADEAGLVQSTVSKMENGVPFSKKARLQLFHAINRLRKKEGWSAVDYDDIDWPV